jgi:hypothetical protein
VLHPKLVCNVYSAGDAVITWKKVWFLDASEFKEGKFCGVRAFRHVTDLQEIESKVLSVLWYSKCGIR